MSDAAPAASASAASGPLPPRSAARPSRRRQRKLTDGAMKLIALGASLLGCAMLGWILLSVARRGIGALNAAVFTQLPPVPGGTGGGIGNGILGTLYMTALATVVGVPLGLGAGVYLAEFGRGSALAKAVRFASNLLMGVPSIIVGIFIYTILVVPLGGFSGYAGAAALTIIMLPVVTGTTEDMLRLVPNSIREAGMALGIPRWRITFQVLFRAAKSGLLTGVILSVARVSGETAPLLFTALNSQYWPDSLADPTPNLTVQIFNFATSPYADWHQLAWAASLLITAGVLVATIFCRLLLRAPGGR